MVVSDVESEERLRAAVTASDQKAKQRYDKKRRVDHPIFGSVIDIIPLACEYSVRIVFRTVQNF